MAVELRESFDEYYDGIMEDKRSDENDAEPGHEHFVIDSTEKAEWVLRKIHQAQAKVAANKQFADAEIDKIQAWLEDVNKQHESTIQYMTSLLEAYHRNLYAQGQLGKTERLPHGELRLRKPRPEFQRDEDTLLGWARTQGLVRVKETPDWATIKKRGQIHGTNLIDSETGEIIPGVYVFVPKQEDFSVKVVDD